MPAKFVTYNSQNYAGTLGSGLPLQLLLASYISYRLASYIFNDNNSK